MEALDEPPPRQDSKKESETRLGLKKVLLSPKENQFIPPQGLRTGGGFERLGITNALVVQDTEDKDKITLFPRLIYRECYKKANVKKSCIVKRQGRLQGLDVKLFPEEQTVFQAEAPHGRMGVEDFRAIKLSEEAPLHGFLVNFNGFDTRTSYVRTFRNSPKDFSKWEQFNIFFPNIIAEEAISLVRQERYKKIWEASFGRQTLEEAKKSRRQDLPETPILGVKDCCLWPNKVMTDIGEGVIEYYGIVIRLLPDIQIIYIKSFEDLAKHEFWVDIVSKLEKYILLERKYDWEKSHIGLGGPPLKLEQGVLLSYHGASLFPKRNYQWGAVLLDSQNPQKVLARTRKPLYSATEPWEREGLVAGSVVFPTGYAISSEGIVHGFYGAADKFVGHVTTTEKKLLEALEN